MDSLMGFIKKGFDPLCGVLTQIHIVEAVVPAVVYAAAEWDGLYFVFVPVYGGAFTTPRSLSTAASAIPGFPA